MRKSKRRKIGRAENTSDPEEEEVVVSEEEESEAEEEEEETPPKKKRKGYPSKYQLIHDRFFIDFFKKIHRFCKPKDSYVYLFLSNFTRSSYMGLFRSWGRKYILCSEVTGKLVEEILGIKRKYIRKVSFYEPCFPAQSAQRFPFEVYSIPSDYCNGGSMWLKMEDGESTLYTTKFRYSEEYRDKNLHRILDLMDNSELVCLWLNNYNSRFDCHLPSRKDVSKELCGFMDGIRMVMSDHIVTFFVLTSNEKNSCGKDILVETMVNTLGREYGTFSCLESLYDILEITIGERILRRIKEDDECSGVVNLVDKKVFEAHKKKVPKMQKEEDCVVFIDPSTENTVSYSFNRFDRGYYMHIPYSENCSLYEMSRFLNDLGMDLGKKEDRKRVKLMIPDQSDVFFRRLQRATVNVPTKLGILKNIKNMKELPIVDRLHQHSY